MIHHEECFIFQTGLCDAIVGLKETGKKTIEMYICPHWFVPWWQTLLRPKGDQGIVLCPPEGIYRYLEGVTSGASPIFVPTLPISLAVRVRAIDN